MEVKCSDGNCNKNINLLSVEGMHVLPSWEFHLTDDKYGK